MKSSGSLCLTVVMDCTGNTKAVSASLSGMRPANMMLEKSARNTNLWLYISDGSHLILNRDLLSFMKLALTLSAPKLHNQRMTQKQSQWGFPGVSVVTVWLQWQVQDRLGWMLVPAEPMWRTRWTWPSWRWSMLLPLTDLRVENREFHFTFLFFLQWHQNEFLQ